MKVVFVIGSVVVTGGNYVIFQHALHASEAGHEVTIVTLHPFTPSELRWHPALARLNLVHIDRIQDLATREFDLAIATWWKTALELHRFQAKQYAYFVQSIEARFFEPHEDSARRIVDETYAMGLPGVTEAAWIQQYLKKYYGSDYLVARNGIRKDLYVPSGPSRAPRAAGKLRVLVEGPFSTPFKNTARSIRLAGRSGADEVWLLTSSDMSWYPGVSRVFSRIPIGEVAQIYRSCDVLLKLSFVEGMFGPPLEMFHCGGTAVVYDVSGHDEYIVDGKNALVARMNDEARVLEHLRRLRRDPELLRDLEAGAAKTAAAWPGWPESSARFVSHLEALREAEPVPRDQLIAAAVRLREEYPEILGRTDSTDPRPARSGLVSRGIRRLRSRVQPWKAMLEHIAEGYRAPFDHRHALTPAAIRPRNRVQGSGAQ